MLVGLLFFYNRKKSQNYLKGKKILCTQFAIVVPKVGVRPKYRKKSSFLVIYLHYGTEAVRNGQDTNNAKHFSDEIVEDEFAYFIVENYEQSCEKVKEVLKRRDL